MVAGGTADDAGLQGLPGERSDLVIGAAELEREYRLQVLPFQPDAVPETGGKTTREFQRRFAGNVIDGRIRDPVQVIVADLGGFRHQGSGYRIPGERSQRKCELPVIAGSPPRRLVQSAPVVVTPWLLSPGHLIMTVGATSPRNPGE